MSQHLTAIPRTVHYIRSSLSRVCHGSNYKSDLNREEMLAQASWIFPNKINAAYPHASSLNVTLHTAHRRLQVCTHMHLTQYSHKTGHKRWRLLYNILVQKLEGARSYINSRYHPWVWNPHPYYFDIHDQNNKEQWTDPVSST